MKNRKHMRIKILWIAILLFQFFGARLANAQVNTPLASLTQCTQDESTSEYQVPQNQILNNVQNDYRVNFRYQDQVMEGQYVVLTRQELMEMNGKRLADILTGLNLTYTQLNEYTYVISQSESSEFVWQETISGTVTAAATGEALPGVNILIQATYRGTATDVDGRFSFQVPSLDQVLVFTYIGYQTVEIPLDGRTTLDVAMEMQTFEGEGLVVVGYGTQRKETHSGSISSISGSDRSEE